jgi:hypothetical protein
VKLKGGWNKLHPGKLHDLYTSPNTYYQSDQIKKDKMGKACSMYEAVEKCIRPLGKPGHRWADNSKISAWIGLIWFRLGAGGRLF